MEPEPLSLVQFALKVKNREICDIRGFDCINCDNSCDLIDVTASIYDRKTDARRFESTFDTIHGILRSLSLAQSLRKSRNAQIWRIGNRRVKELI